MKKEENTIGIKYFTMTNKIIKLKGKLNVKKP